MKVIIAGSRGMTSYNLIKQCIKDSGFEITEIVSGMCKNSPDILAFRYGIENNIPIKQFKITKETWNNLGKKAGPLRNKSMAEYGEALIAIWNDISSGTKNMIKCAHENNLLIFVYRNF